MSTSDSLSTVSYDPRYPIGRVQLPSSPVSMGERASAVSTLAALPEQLRNAVEDLSPAQLDTPYRAGGWTVRQVVHHLADSHMNAFSRFKLGLTEQWPTIYPYNEDAWSNLHDASAPVEWSLELVEAVHARWIMLLQSLSEADWERGFVHPERGRMPLDVNAVLYAWHSRHHVAHITHLRAERGW